MNKLSGWEWKSEVKGKMWKNNIHSVLFPTQICQFWDIDTYGPVRTAVSRNVSWNSWRHPLWQNVRCALWFRCCSMGLVAKEFGDRKGQGTFLSVLTGWQNFLAAASAGRWRHSHVTRWSRDRNAARWLVLTTVLTTARTGPISHLVAHGNYLCQW